MRVALFCIMSLLGSPPEGTAPGGGFILQQASIRSRLPNQKGGPGCRIEGLLGLPKRKPGVLLSLAPWEAGGARGAAERILPVAFGALGSFPSQGQTQGGPSHGGLPELLPEVDNQPLV